MRKRSSKSHLRYPLGAAPPELQPPDPATPKGRILAAARDLFAQQGLDGTTTRAIAAAAGVNLAMIHYYFGSKEQLYEAVLIAEFIRLRNPLSDLAFDSLRPEEVVLAVPFHIMSVLRANPVWTQLVRHELVLGGRHFANVARKLGAFGPLGLRQVFDAKFELGVKRKKLRPLAVDPVRECLIAIAYGVIFLQPLYKVLFGRDITDEVLWRNWRETLGTLLRHGLLAEKA